MIHEIHSGDWTPGLTEAEKETLLRIAEATLDACTRGQEMDLDEFDLTPSLSVPMATFVTLKLRGMLRGCIGSLEARVPLARSVQENTIGAARRDPRFPPVSEGELGGLAMSLSILSPIEPIPDLDDFHVGEHGIILEKDGRSAVFLPEVAPEQGWSRDDTLSALSQKAGLPPDAWRDSARFRIFSSVHLSRSSEDNHVD